jgi:DNA invertase Pin-like site-specific DNA recombinase
VVIDTKVRVVKQRGCGNAIAKLRAQGLGWKKISRELGVAVSTVLRVAQETGSENPKPKTVRTLGGRIRIDSAGGSAVAAAFR